MAILQRALMSTVVGIALNGAGAQGAPVISRVTLANGSFSTDSRTVSLAIATTGSAPTAFRTSEKADMSGAMWRKFTTSPSITLSAEPGGKIIFVQVGVAPSITTSTSTTTKTLQPLTGDFVVPPTVLSNIARDTIILGLPDIRSTVTMPSVVRDGKTFEFSVLISNAGQMSPPDEVIEVYNSFVTNTIQLDFVEVAFLGQLRGKGCKITDTPTVECSVAPLAPNGAITINVTATVRNGVPRGQTQITQTLRTRISGVRESNSTNNWRDTPITIVK